MAVVWYENNDRLHPHSEEQTGILQTCFSCVELDSVSVDANQAVKVSILCLFEMNIFISNFKSLDADFRILKTVHFSDCPLQQFTI